jgi:hypothetical protein
MNPKCSAGSRSSAPWASISPVATCSASPRQTPASTATARTRNFLKPSILIYEPQPDGSLALVAVENLVFAKAWKEAGHDVPPSFHGITYDSMADDPATPADEAHFLEPHYDRHVWIYRENPNRVFAPFNPAVTCEHHKNGAEPQHAAHGG